MNFETELPLEVEEATNEVEEEAVNEEEEEDKNESVSEMRDVLLVLCTMGQSKNYFGKEFSIPGIHKMSNKKVEKYFNMYKKISSMKITKLLLDNSLFIFVDFISYFLPLDDKKILAEKLKNNDLLSSDMEYYLGFLILRGGKFIGLLSGLVQIVSHIKNDTINFKISDEN